ncbi:hypothetical protein [Floccifex sp.]|uniref:hypothetical protein n=1 Tax=Floccifex sp. TaxID=2815810 RepID=UPI002A75F826|nr:hypothetical protein [Floccifex sp.]MDD7281905.1 hypothetical protein [Erysipelotrichaceae bacterium]MDY2957472.1 hypothetical protein [Floccifex sp.]
MFKKFMKMGLAGLLALSFSACSAQEDEPVSILCPSGAPALALLGLAHDENVSIDYASQDVLQAELSKKDGEYDVIVAPTNLGAKLYGASETYQLQSVLTWGNLYIVGPNGQDFTQGSIGAFGENAVPQLVFNYSYDTTNLDVTYYSDVAQAQQALLTGQVDSALLAMPVAQACIAKGKENNMDLAILSDVQASFKEKSGSDLNGYPQASLFVKKDSVKKVDYVLNEISEFIDSCQQQDILDRIDEVGAETLGVPSAEICAKTWDKQNIRFVQANEAKDDIINFLSLFNIEVNESLFVE